MPDDSPQLKALYAELDALQAFHRDLQSWHAQLMARHNQPLSPAERRELDAAFWDYSARITANTERMKVIIAAVYAAKGMLPPQANSPLSRRPIQPAKKKTSFMGWVVVAIGALVIAGWIASAFNRTDTNPTAGPSRANQAARATQSDNRFSTNDSGQQTWNGIPISQLTGNEWMQMSEIEKSALVYVYLSGVPYCTESVSQGVSALNTIFAPVANRTSDITGVFAGWIVSDGCRKPA